MLKKLQQRKSESGFTIIEVLIVLAIAGLIMVIVFLAIPNLQRSQRNTSRKTDANNVLSAVSDYVSNNGGVLPTAQCAGTACPFLNAASGVKVGYFSTKPTDNAVVYYPNLASMPTPNIVSSPATPNTDTLWIVAGATCASAAQAPVAGTSRQLVAFYGIEGSVFTQCTSE